MQMLFFLKAKLTLTGLNDDTSKASTAASLYGNRIEESFIHVLDDKRQGAKSMEESFVVLGSASMLRGPGGPGPGGHATQQQAQQLQQQQQQAQQAQQAAQQQQSDGMAVGLDAKLQALAQLFEMASLQTHVDHPLCLDCEAQLKDEIEAQIQEAEREVAAYSAAVARLEAEKSHEWADEATFRQEMKNLVDEEQRERQRAAALERELAEVQQEVQALHTAAADLDALEERYWHDYNDYHLQLRVHVDERDGLLNKIDRATQRLHMLRNTNVYNDAFKIWHDGPFGTISGFRLGRTNDTPVEWDEINAAWGQAVLLLYTMAQACSITFSTYKLLPMGSHPRVADKHTTYDLFGPVNKLWSTKYDKAMIVFLTCLKEFGQAAHSEDMAAGKPDPFKFPFAIDGDKVNNYSIKLTLNADAKWTKALKFMLANLKVALQWMVKHRMAVAAPPQSLEPEPAQTLDRAWP